MTSQKTLQMHLSSLLMTHHYLFFHFSVILNGKVEFEEGAVQGLNSDLDKT